MQTRVSKSLLDAIGGAGEHLPSEGLEQLLLTSGYDLVEMLGVLLKPENLSFELLLLLDEGCDLVLYS